MPLELETASIAELVDKVIARHRYEESALIGVLQDVQQELEWLPQEALKHIAKRLDVPLNRVYHVATFYRAFNLKPRGRHVLSICMGTACHVRGAKRVLEEIERQLVIKAPDTTPDQRFTINPVNCLGACALGPVVVVDGQYHAQVTAKKVKSILNQYA